MGALAEAMVAYAQPLLDQTDGSHEELNKALSLSSLCYTLGQLPAANRDEALSRMRSSVEMSDEDFEEFKSSIVLPMIARYDAMFSKAVLNVRPIASHDARSITLPAELSGRAQPITIEPPAKKSEPLPYSLCPCNSGKKYKFCCKQTK